MHMLIYILCCLMRLEIIIKDSAGFAWNRWADLAMHGAASRCCCHSCMCKPNAQRARQTKTI